MLDHLDDAILQRSPAELICDGDQVVFGAFDVHHVILTLEGRLQSILSAVAGGDALASLGGYDRQIENLLFRDCEGIWVIEAAQIDVLKSVILVIDIVENLPGNIKLDLLAH